MVPFPIIIILALAAVGVSYEMGLMVWQGWDTLKWPGVEGRLVWPSELTSRALPMVPTCQFVLNGTEYLAQPRNHHTNRNPTLSELMDRYPDGQTLTIFYDPDNPTNCVLRQGVGYRPLFLFAAALTFLFFIVRALLPAV